ncbi:autophagy-related protein 28 [Physcia stellaris]|nr:autophagy-related protein 28 [Physcia stellaris]
MTKRKGSADTVLNKSRKKRPFCSAHDAATKAKIKHNAEASSLLRLPFEIRSLIYRELLGDRVIHSFNSSILSTDRDVVLQLSWPRPNCSQCKIDSEDVQTRRWFHSVCRKPESIARDYELFDSGDQQGTEYSSHVGCSQTWNLCACPCPPWAPFERLDLRILRSCRQLYNESNQALWTTNTFAFDNQITFRLFMRAPNHIQKQLLSKIYMRQYWLQHWEETMDRKILNSLKGLRAVHVMIESDEDELSAFGPEISAQTEMDFKNLTVGSTNILFRTVESLNEASVVIKGYKSDGLEKPAIMKQLRDFAKRAEQRLLDPNSARTRRQVKDD